MERVALLTERMVGLSAEHITKQQVLSSAMATGAISTATMAAAQEKLALSLAKSAAAQGALSTAQAAAQKVVSLQQELAIAQSNFVSSGGGPGQMVLWQQMQATETELNRAKLATAGLTDAEVDLAAANREVASTQKLITEAMAASTFAMAGTVAIIAAVIAVLVALVIAIYSAKKAWDEFWIAVKVGAAEQTDMFGLKAMIGDSQKAKQALVEYWAITDHSKSSFQASGLDAQRLREQILEIKKLNEKIAARGGDFRLLCGSGVDILKVRLDFDDALLAELDVVVASLHVSSSNEAENTKRLIRAAENPFVHIIAHPTGRLLLEREPYPVNGAAGMDARAATGA